MMCGIWNPKPSLVLWISLGLGLMANVCFAQPTHSPLESQTLDQALDNIKERKTRRIPYQESRLIPSLKTPIMTHGVLEFIPPETLIKKVEAPVPATYLLSKSEIRLTDEVTGETHSLKPDAIPELAYIGSSLMSLLMGDKATLLTRWQVTVGGTHRRWEMNLLPADQRASGLRRIRVEGREGLLQQIYIESNDGSISTLKLGLP